jgi:peptidoglycan/xylan/chitin deacetylase (PgdA/CDA1 family)
MRISATARAVSLLARTRHSALVFVFHDVPDRAWFEECVRDISSARKILPLEEVVGGTPDRSCALTFDDGRRSIADVVHPVLRRRKTPYTVFVCSDVLTGGPVPWFVRADHLAAAIGLEPLRSEWDLGHEFARTKEHLITALKEIPFESLLVGLGRLEQRNGISPPSPSRLFLQPDDIGQLAAEDVSFQAHSHRHPILARLAVEEQTSEIEMSLNEVQSISGTRPSHFAYPNGGPMDFDDSTVSILRAHGFSHAYTTVQRHLSPENDAFAVPRVGISAGDGATRRALAGVSPWLSRAHAREEKIRKRMRQVSAGRPAGS